MTWDCRECHRSFYTRAERVEHERVTHRIGQQTLGEWSE